ncbi:MAG: hypothetical protein U5K28_12610 [Halobacteriales archaeon]|nr:hypothetical protein [Halobacteriales archaeon]
MRRLLLVGVVVVAAGLAATVVPAISGLIPASALGSLVGFLAVLGAIGSVTRRVRADPETRDLPTLETIASEPPGDQFDEQVRIAGNRQTPRAGSHETTVRTRLREAAVETLVREGHSEATANDRLRAGTWTDDPDAATFFVPTGDDQPRTLLADAQTDITSQQTVRGFLDDTPLFEHRVKRVVAVLNERLAETTAEGTEGAAGDGQPAATEGAAGDGQPAATEGAAGNGQPESSEGEEGREL